MSSTTAKGTASHLKKRVGKYFLGRTIGEVRRCRRRRLTTGGPRKNMPPVIAVRCVQGTYAKVKYGQHSETGQAVAVKVLDKEALVRSGMVEQIKREITILKQVSSSRKHTKLVGNIAGNIAVVGNIPRLRMKVDTRLGSLLRGVHVGSMLSVARSGCLSLADPCYSSQHQPPHHLHPSSVHTKHLLYSAAALLPACRVSPQIRHPHIVNLLEVMSSKDCIFMVLELVTGGELFDKIVAEGPMKASSRCWRRTQFGVLSCWAGWSVGQRVTWPEAGASAAPQRLEVGTCANMQMDGRRWWLWHPLRPAGRQGPRWRGRLSALLVCSGV
jgi:hypothetical protein